MTSRKVLLICALLFIFLVVGAIITALVIYHMKQIEKPSTTTIKGKLLIFFAVNNMIIIYKQIYL